MFLQQAFQHENYFVLCNNNISQLFDTVVIAVFNRLLICGETAIQDTCLVTVNSTSKTFNENCFSVL